MKNKNMPLIIGVIVIIIVAAIIFATQRDSGKTKPHTGVKR